MKLDLTPLTIDTIHWALRAQEMSAQGILQSVLVVARVEMEQAFRLQKAHIVPDAPVGGTAPADDTGTPSNG